MRKFLALATGAALLGGTMLATSADARPGYRHYHGGYGYGAPRYYGGGYGYRRRGNAGAAVAAGIAGALIGGAIAAQQPRPYYYGRPAYGPGYGYYGPPRPAYYYGY